MLAVGELVGHRRVIGRSIARSPTSGHAAQADARSGRSAAQPSAAARVRALRHHRWTGSIASGAAPTPRPVRIRSIAREWPTRRAGAPCRRRSAAKPAMTPSTASSAATPACRTRAPAPARRDRGSLDGGDDRLLQHQPDGPIRPLRVAPARFEIGDAVARPEATIEVGPGAERPPSPGGRDEAPVRPRGEGGGERLGSRSVDRIARLRPVKDDRGHRACHSTRAKPHRLRSSSQVPMALVRASTILGPISLGKLCARFARGPRPPVRES